MVGRALFETSASVTMTTAQQDRVWELLMENCLVHTESEGGEISLSPPYPVVVDKFGRNARYGEIDE